MTGRNTLDDWDRYRNVGRSDAPEGAEIRRLFEDSVNDREPGTDRVNSEPTSSDVIGAQRPRSVLKLDISAERMEPVMVASLEKNPYVIPLHKVAAAGKGVKNAI